MAASSLMLISTLLIRLDHQLLELSRSEPSSSRLVDHEAEIIDSPKKQQWATDNIPMLGADTLGRRHSFAHYSSYPADYPGGKMAGIRRRGIERRYLRFLSTEQFDRVHGWQTGTESGESIPHLNHTRADLT
jgi:hypothetical protein